MYGVIGAVTSEDLGQSGIDAHSFAGRPRGHVDEDEDVQQVTWWCAYLRQLRAETALFCFELRARVMRNERDDKVAAPDAREEARAVQRVKAGPGQLGRVPDVVQPGGGGQVDGEAMRAADCLSFVPHGLDMRPSRLEPVKVFPRQLDRRGELGIDHASTVAVPSPHTLGVSASESLDPEFGGRNGAHRPVPRVIVALSP